jgi:uncharacterized protein
MVQVSYPGVYIQEVPSGVRTITGVATSITAFVGYTARGPDNKARRIHNFGDYERVFGGLQADSEVSYAVQHFFDNGGTDAYVVRVPKSDADVAAITVFDKTGAGRKKALVLTAVSTGEWGNQVFVDVDHRAVGDSSEFNLTITDSATERVERFARVTTDSTKSRYVKSIVNDVDNGSQFIVCNDSDAGAGRPPQTGTVGGDIDVTTLKNDKDYSIKITCDLPAGTITNEEVVVFKKDEPLPASALGVARLLERRINALVDEKFKSVLRVRCDVADTDQSLRLWVDQLDGAVTDAIITVSAGAPNSALSMLKLDAANVDETVAHYLLGVGRTVNVQSGATAGDDGTDLPVTGDLIGSEGQFTGIYALAKVDLFNILCIPDATRAGRGNPTVLYTDSGGETVDPNQVFAKAHKFCEDHRAFLVIDAPPPVNDADRAAGWKGGGLTVKGKNAAAYFPRLRLADPLDKFKLRTFAPCGVVAGLYARTDATRGVWKAPAGTEATLTGVQAQAYTLTDLEHGTLNPLGLNCFRKFPVYNHVAWGARTLEGADVDASEWKYVPVRRLALFLEESLFRGTQWVIFEPNDEPLWAQIRLNVGAFMHSLFVLGAFAGKSPRDAYRVKCDAETTTQDDVNRGVVNLLVGFAPLKPAEFLIIKIQQLAGQIQT